MKYLTSLTLLNVFVALGFSTVGVLDPQLILPPSASVTPAATTFALYGFVRSLALAGLTMVAVVQKDERKLVCLAVLAGTIQLLDAAVGVYQADIIKTLGPIGLGVAQFWAIQRYSRPL